MMKNIFLIAICTIFIGGCSLDREPETTLSDVNFWRSETDLRGACNRLYIDLPGFLTGRGHDLRSEELIGNTPDEISSGNRSVPETDKEWTDPYNKIGICNNIIIKGENVDITENIKNRWLAEARFFRAFYYFDLVRKYGDVPLILKVFNNTSDPDIKKARDSRETVIQQCYKDLDFAAQWLPDIDKLSDNTNWGRVSRSAALGMIVRIGLYEGTYIKYHNLTEGDSRTHLKKSIDAAEAMFKENKHDLYPDFQSLFYFDGEGRKNKENVFVKIYGPNGINNAITWHNQCASKTGQASITRQMIDNFLYIDGLPKSSSTHYQMETKFDDIFLNRDPRLKMTVFAYKEISFKNAEYLPFDNVNHSGYGYPIKKGYMKEEYDTNSKETVDKMIIRYAEILISYAEALYEYNGKITDEQLEATVNYIRRRSGFNTELTNQFVLDHQLNMLEEIRRERIVEFIDENIHYDDIIRWKIAENLLPKAMLGILFNPGESAKTDKELNYKFTDANGVYNGVKVYDQANIYVIEEADSRKFDPKRDYLYPIPSYEIATSNGNIKQNPYWN